MPTLDAMPCAPEAPVFLHVTRPLPCPYLAGRTERKVVLSLTGSHAGADYEALIRGGFRRSQTVAYRPACRGCRACVPVRVPVARFRASRSLARVRRRNADLQVRHVPCVARPEHSALFRRYLRGRHGDGEMADMDHAEYRDMVEESHVDTRLSEFRDPGGALLGVCLYDRLADGLSAVYTFFEPAQSRRSPGSYMILWLIEHASELGLAQVYLGYWIADCRKMAYKTRFWPLEGLGSEGWRVLEP